MHHNVISAQTTSNYHKIKGAPGGAPKNPREEDHYPIYQSPGPYTKLPTKLSTELSTISRLEMDNVDNYRYRVATVLENGESNCYHKFISVMVDKDPAHARGFCVATHVSGDHKTY